MGELETKKATVKEMIRQLHEGANVETVKEQFKRVLRMITPTEISQIEGELVEEGMPREEIQRLCDVHLEVFREALEREKTLAPAGHPIHILMAEHSLLLGFAEELRALSQDPAASDGARPGQLIAWFKDSASHYLREENVLFPYLEKHGITQPPAIMWSEHDQIRQIEKMIYAAWETHGALSWAHAAPEIAPGAMALAEMLSSHFYKENNILYPTSLKVMTAAEWQEARRQFDEIGYTPFTPPAATVPLAGAEPTPAAAAAPPAEGVITLETGSLTVAQLEAIFKTLPVDLTFVGSDDRVKFFSLGPERIFARTKAIIGRAVQNCHPQKSVHVVNRILDDFRRGARDHADFWIEMNGRFIYIRYFAVRDEQGAYLGCLEVVQDATEVRQLQGQKRLLD